MQTLTQSGRVVRQLTPLLIGCILAVIGGFHSALAQDVAAEARTAPASESGGATNPKVTTADVVRRLDLVGSRLQTVNDYLRKPAPDLAGITVALPGKTREAEAVLGGAEAVDPLSADLVELMAAAEKLRSLDRIFGKWRGRLQQEITVLDPWRGELRSDAGFLRDAADPAASGTDGKGADQLPDALRTRMRQVATDLETTLTPLRRRLDVVVAADVRVGEMQASLRELGTQLDATRLSRQEQTLAITAPPIWKLPGSLRQPLELTRQNIDTLKRGIDDYAETRSAELMAFGLVLVILLVAVARLRHSVVARGVTDVDQLLTRYPFSITLLVWALVGPFLLLPGLPIGGGLLRGFIAAVLLWRVLPVLVSAGAVRPLKALLLLAVAFLVQLIVLGDDWYGRVVTVVLGIVAVLVFRAVARASVVDRGGRSAFRRAIHGVAVIAPAVIAVGLIAEIVGARALAQQLIGGIVFVSLALCTLLAVDAILCSIVDAWVGGPGARWFRSVRNWPDALRTWGRRLIRLLLLIAFINLLPTILPVLEPVWVAIGRGLATKIAFGSVALSLGDVLWFVAGIVLALLSARSVRFVLDEDLLPRLPLAMGAASAASRLIYYALVVVGILFALAASGVELSKLTLVISALGIGIGFGLQNIVNNFVSGLILAFERPVREGDQITLGTTVGRVSQIGLRATRIRTFEGAEVIVPNANLISNEVTNWTLSDRTRRIDVAVGVDYGSDPVQVQALLLEAVKDQPHVALSPAPVTIFRSFGASSLDFSLLIWASDVDQRFAVETEARTRVLTALRSAGVVIPFPQLDVRVKDGVTLVNDRPPAAQA